MSYPGRDEWERGGDDAVAAEYVLGVLPVDERRAAAARIEAEPEFARLVDSWEVRLSPLASNYAEVEPPTSVRQSLEVRLFAAAPVASKWASPWQSLAFWRGLAVAAVAALALYIALPAIAPPPGGTPAARLVASLAPQASDVHYLAVYNAETHDVGLSHVSGARAEGRDFELWVIEGDNPPESLGVIPEGETAHLPLGEETRTRLGRGAVLAVSVEPLGGSPTGRPTGPVVAAGDLRSI